MSYLPESRLKKLEKSQNRKTSGVIIVFVSPSGKSYLDADGKKANISKYRTVIINDIPRKAEQEKEGGDSV